MGKEVRFMIFKGRGFRMDVDVERTRAYYEAYAASGKATLLQRNQQAYFDKVLSPGAKGFLRMLGIVNHLPMGFGQSCLVEGRVRHMPIAYPVFGHYAQADGGSLPVGADGRLVWTPYNVDERQKVFTLYVVGKNFQTGYRPLFPEFPGPLLVLGCNTMFADWMLEEPCPLPTSERLWMEKEKTRKADLIRKLQSALEAEGFHPQMLDDAPMRALYEGWRETFAGDSPADARLHEGFTEARGLDVSHIDDAYRALPTGEYHLMLGQMDACARIQSDRLPSLRLLDSFLQNEIYLVDAAQRHCLYGQSDWRYAPYVLAPPSAPSVVGKVEPKRKQSGYDPIFEELQLEMMLHISGNKWEKGSPKEWKKVISTFLYHFVPKKRRGLGARLLKGKHQAQLWNAFRSLVPDLCVGDAASARYEAHRTEIITTYLHMENPDEAPYLFTDTVERRERFMIYMHVPTADFFYHARGALPSADQLARFVRMDIYVCPESLDWIYALDHEGMGPYFIVRRYQ